MFDPNPREDPEDRPDRPSGWSLLDLNPRKQGEERPEDRSERSSGWSLLDLESSAPASPEAKAEAEAGANDIFEIEHRPERAFPIERAILFSIAAHILLLVLILKAPMPSSSGRHRGLLGALVESEREKELQRQIPIVFRSAPGPARANPNRSDLSDATRKAGGGDPSRPRSQTPFIAPLTGKEGLPPGAAAAAPRPRPQQATGVGKDSAPAAAPGEKQAAGPEAFQVPAPGKASAGREGPRLADLQRAMEDAARGVVPSAPKGDSGAGFPNPEGGFVDSGPISFDTTWYDWGPYAEEMVRRIKLHWDIPELARLGWKGKLTIRFFIRGDGRVEGAKILKVSGVPPFDFAALQAILTSSPFRPLPKDLGSDREGVTVTFFYNIRPEKEGRGDGSH